MTERANCFHVAIFILFSLCHMTLTLSYYATNKSPYKSSFLLSMRPCRHLQKTHNGDLKANSASFPFCIHGLRLLWTIFIFTVLFLRAHFQFAKDGWIPAKDSFLFRIDSLAKEFRNRYLRAIRTAYLKEKLIFPGNTAEFGEKQTFEQLIQSLSEVKWIAYAKAPFAGPEQVLEYLGRYTHRVAISNNRIVAIDNGKVTFTYLDRENNETKAMTIDADEFIRRFLLHILPKGFMKIRYFGFLAHRNKKQAIPILRKLINPDAKLPEKVKETVQEMMLRVTGNDITCCPKCKKGKMIIVKNLPKPDRNSS